MKKFLLLTAIFWLCGSSFAQNPHSCAVDSLLMAYPDYITKTNTFAAELSEFRSRTPLYHQFLPNGIQPLGITAGCQDAAYIVPVVIHIDTSGGIVHVSDTQVYQQLVLLNNIFSSHGIRFVLAKKRPNGTSFSGINRFGGTFDYRYHNLAQSYSTAPNHYYDPSRYMNIYVVPDILDLHGNPSTINGFNNVFADMISGMPDLVVIRHTKFGDYASCMDCGTLTTNSRGLVAVHEVGHYLGLRELWQGGCNEGNTAQTCSRQGDLCCDTRPINTNFACPAPGGNDCSYHLSIPDNHENYMDYTAEDCQDNFTPDQITLMQATLELYRNKLISPQNLNLLDLDDCFATAWFDAESNFTCDSAAFTLHAIDYENATNYRWIIRLDTQTFLDTILNVHILNWKNPNALPGKYDVFLEITYNSSDIAKVTRFAYLEVADCGTPLASEQGHWYFGNHAGLRFTAGGAVRDLGPYNRGPNNINTSEGTISHSDSLGNLLFYGGGSFMQAGAFDVYNRHYQPMPGSPIFGDVSSCQAGVAVKVPNNASQYYLFTVAGIPNTPGRGFHYSIIDMSLDGGNGDFVDTLKNIPVKGPTAMEHSPFDSALNTSEQITVIPKCGGNAHWILITNGYDDQNTNGIFILVFELDENGIRYHSMSSEPLVTGINSSSPIGQLKASPDGNWVALWGSLYRFDKLNGILSLYRELDVEDYVATSFSPNSRFLYLVEADSLDPWNSSNLVQFDLMSTNSDLDKKVVSSYPFENAHVAMQMGPDNKIYISRFANSRLAEIATPDHKITTHNPNACQYTLNGPILSENGIGGISSIGLPNMRDALFEYELTMDFAMIDSACGTVTFIPNKHCEALYLWHFGDGDSSLIKSPIHTYNDTGLYTVSLYLDGVIALQKELYIGIKSRIAGSHVACLPEPINTGYSISNYYPEFEYQWGIQGGSIVSYGFNENIEVAWDSGGYLTLNIQNPLNSCILTDTLFVSPSILTNNIIANSYTGACFPGAALEILGDSVYSSDGITKYQWMIKGSGNTWEVLVNDTFPILNGKTEFEDVYYRRKAYNNFCLNYSDSIQVKPNIRITKHPEDVSKCPGSYDNRTFNLGGMFTSWQPYKVYFMVNRHIAPYGYDYRAEDSIPSLGLYFDESIVFSIGGNTDGYFFKIVTPCGDYHSDTSEIFTCNFPNNWNVSVPDSFFVDEDDSVTIVRKNTPCLDGPPLPGTSIYWQYSPNGSDWKMYLDSAVDTLRFSASACQDGHYFRMVYAQNCFVDTLYSPYSRVFVSKTNLSDLWSKDSPADVGNEPNNASQGDYWNSPDIWNNRNASVYSANHQNPVYGNTNKIFARVRNKGTGYSKPARVYLYWTLPSTQEDWPKHWTYNLMNNGFENTDDSLIYPLGSEINEVGIDLGPLAPDSDTVISYEWTPPNPEWYYFDSSGVKVYYTQRMLCFLMRIVECEQTPYGMAFPEVVETTVNVKNNNNITTKNVTLFNEDGEWVLPISEYFPVIVGAHDELNSPIRLNFVSVYGTDFYDYGTVSILFEDSLLNEWIAAGENGYGYSRSGNRFTITDPLLFEISNIPVEYGRIHQVLVEVKIDSLPLFDYLPFLFKLVQFTDSSMVADGGVYVEGIIPMKPPVIVEERIIKQEHNTETPDIPNPRSLQKEKEAVHNESNQALIITQPINNRVTVYPNPFDKEVNFRIELEEEAEMQIILYNSLGAWVGEIPAQKQPKGQHQFKYNGEHLAPGIYHGAIRIGDVYHNVKLIITR